MATLGFSIFISMIVLLIFIVNFNEAVPINKLLKHNGDGDDVDNVLSDLAENFDADQKSYLEGYGDDLDIVPFDKRYGFLSSMSNRNLVNEKMTQLFAILNKSLLKQQLNKQLLKQKLNKYLLKQQLRKNLLKQRHHQQ